MCAVFLLKHIESYGGGVEALVAEIQELIGIDFDASVVIEEERAHRRVTM